jgi:hypothetical protein
MGASQFSLTASCFSVEDLARYIHKTPNTVRKWFTKEDGLRYLPRGKQSPHVLIPPEVVLHRLREFGFTEKELDELIAHHESRLTAPAVRASSSLTPKTVSEVKPVQTSKPASVAAKRRGRPPGVKRRKA